MGKHSKDTSEFKVRTSLRTKVLMGTFFIFVTVLAALVASTIKLLIDDKESYTYQTQLLEGELVGKELAGLLKTGMDRTEAILAYPERTLTSQQRFELTNVLEYEQNLSELRSGTVSINSGDVSFADNVKKKSDKNSRTISKKLNPKQLNSLKTDGYLLLPVQSSIEESAIAVLMANLQEEISPGVYPIAVAVVNTQSLSKPGIDLIIATNAQDVLFASHESKSSAQGVLFNAAMNSKLASGVQDFEEKGSRYFGAYVKPGFGSVVLVQMPWKKAMVSARILGEKLLILSVAALCAVLIFTIFFSRGITASVNRIFYATQQVAQGNFDVQVKVKSHDEVGVLARSFSAMSQKIKALLEESVEKTKLENELQIAATVQKNLFPTDTYSDDRVRIASFYASATHCGGDWWGFFSNGSKLCAMIGDATGHGLPSALITSAARSSLGLYEMMCEQNASLTNSPERLLSFANRAVYSAGAGSLQMTMFGCVFDFNEQKLRFANAGHNPPYHLRRKPEVSGFEVKSLMGHGHRLGEDPVVQLGDVGQVSFQSGDVFVFYTDGIIENPSADGEMLGKKRFRKLLAQLETSEPSSVVAFLLNEYNNHVKGRRPDDDTTLVVFEIA